MSKFKFMFLLIFLLQQLTACSTMNFVNGPEMDETVEREQWHHLTFYGLIEVSPPMDVNYNCGRQQWDTITVEKSFFNGVADAVILHWPYFVSLYNPMTIRYECRDSIDS